ncbi:uncharacterized protein LOC110912739 isoform X1 [Helianthus annuus]|uniref:uncharacterized protein LOC110912739 isoform X1 n=1 Tax=Helianthus annuus TaxID=4232 RepID=UPI001652BA46|nr:uncharacterized protein LOC110912739 isoform X1 [Helianthus annuus]
MDHSSVIQVNLQLSWASSGKQDVEDYNGWVFGEESVGSKRQTKGLPTFVLFDIGSSVVALLDVFAHLALSKKGFVFRFHVLVDKKSLGSEDGLKVDECFDEPMMENVDVIAKEGINCVCYSECVIVVDFMFAYFFCWRLFYSKRSC